MTSRVGILGALSAAVVAATSMFALLAPSAQGAFEVTQWEAGTCNVPTCEYTSPEATFFTQVAGRPPFGITDFRFKKNGLGFPEGAVRDVRVDLPPGLSVNPEATDVQCAEAELEGSGCPPTSRVGTVEVTAVELGGTGVPIPAPVFNIVPKPGEPAEFGLRVNLLGIVDTTIYLEGTVAWEADYHEGFTIRNVPNAVPLARNRLVFEGLAGNGTFITVGSDCQGTTTTGLTVDSHEAPGSYLHYDTTPIIPVGPKIEPTGCEKVPFDPSIEVAPGTGKADSPTGGSFDVKVPFEPGNPIGQANVKRAAVSLPLGSGLNPSAAEGLKFCTDQQLAKGIAFGDRITAPDKVVPPAISCPAASKVGTVAIETPVLPPGSLPGDVYLGEQLSRDPESGKEYRIFVNAESPRFGVYVRLIGEIAANPKTGRLTAKFDEPKYGGLPQVPFSSFKLNFDNSKGVLTSPPICGPNTTTTLMVPWTGNAAATPSGSFNLTQAPGGGPCAKSWAERPFAPGLTAKPESKRARAFTSFSAHITRPDGQQELRGVDFRLPMGATAKLKGVPYCPPGKIADAADRAGAAEKKNASCPDKSKIGVATVLAGSGAKPLKIQGDVYLAGRYKGSALSLVVVTPAVAGPFDLGTVVVRVGVGPDTETARVHPDGEIPDVFGGAKLSIRSIFVNVNRKKFTRNGTNCRKGATAGVIRGGGADPTNPAAWSAFKVKEPFKAKGCKKFKFKPRLRLRLFGETQRAKHPKLRAVLKARPKDANIARASVGLPHALFLDQASLATICTRVQFAADDCPKRSIYGKARAFSPLIGKPLQGPVYLRSSNHTLPDLVAHLEGQVTIDLVGRIDSFRGGIRTTFDRVPDVPVKKFVMTLPGGKGGLLVASTNLCAAPVKGIVKLKAQNGRKANRNVTLRTPCGGGKGK
jgi:hypothetical protein